MPKISPSAKDQDGPNMGTEMEKLSGTIAITPMVMVTCGVNRKLNTGNYENIDLYTAVTLPVPDASLENLDELQALIRHAAERGFAMASKEVNERITSLKESLGGGR